MSELKERLKRLPYDEIKSAIDYYEEYFDDAGAENEQQVINSLGNPSDIASKIISEFAIKGIEQDKPTAKKGISIIWLVLLGIFASPIALPLIIAFLAIIFSLIVVVASALFSFGVTAFALIVSGIVSLISSIYILFSDVATGIFFFGAGLVQLAISAVLFWITVFLAKTSFNGIAKLMAKFLKRRGAKNEQ